MPRSGGRLSTAFEVRRTAADPLIVKIYVPERDWFKSIGTVDPLDSIAGDPAAIVRS